MTSKFTIPQKKPSKPSKNEWQPHDYQKKAVEFMLKNMCGGLLLDPGLGKTSICLSAIKLLKARGLVGKVLIVAPLRPCYLVWPEELKKWDTFRDLTYTILHGKDKEANLKKEVDIYIINPDGLEWLLVRDVKKLGFDMLIIDESTMLKRTNTKRFKLIKPTLPLFRRRYILTGSPTPNGYMDLFGQIYLLDLGHALGRFITSYRRDYFYQSGYGGYEWNLQPGAEARIQERVKPLVMRLAAEDYIKLPKLIVSDIYVELDDRARATYKMMEKELIALIRSEYVTAANVASAITKCRQLANGAIYMADRSVEEVHKAKLEAVTALVEELSGVPALIAYEFEHDKTRLIKALGKNTPYIGGGVTPRRTAELEAAWNRGDLPVLLGHPASMGHGLNLQNSGNHVVWFAPTWNYEYYEQLIGRVRRQGARFNTVFVHRILVRGTVDEVVLATLQQKSVNETTLLAALKDYLVKNLEES